MTSKATAILSQLETALEGLAGLSAAQVYRGHEAQAINQTATLPLVIFRPLSNKVEATLGAEARIALEVGFEGRVALTSSHGADAALDDLLIALRGALGLGAAAPLAGLVVRTTGDKAGIVLGDAQYLFPEPGSAYAAVQFVLTFRYVESY
ncbi:MAG TPA: hypothetical protein PK959_13020 [Candidatus Competibacteraceae bacterium]|nr:hypothetical protein [Candidatus Competibacteraceae bacterium]